MAVLELTVSVLLLAANAWFVLFEFALVKMRPSRLDQLVQEGARNAPAIKQMHDEMNDYLGACQLGITMSSLGIGWLAEPALSELIVPYIALDSAHAISFALAFGLITVVHIVLGELVPKSVAIQLPEKALLLSAVPMKIFHAAFKLPLRLLNSTSNLALRLFRLPPAQHAEEALSPEELRIMLGYAYRQGSLSLERSLLVENALDFDAIHARQVMVSLSQAVTLDRQKTWAENAAIMEKQRRSRYPVVDGASRRVVGMVLLKDVALRLLRGEAEPSLDELRRDVLHVLHSDSIDQVLRKMQMDRGQLAVVDADDGTTLGIVTMEDVIEELVGEVYDEFEPVRIWTLSSHFDGAARLDLEAKNHADAVRALAHEVARTVPGLDPDRAVRAVLGREAQGPTAVGRGVAVPHARLPGLGKAHIGFARLKTPLPSRAADGEPVRFMFLILSPEEAPIEQVRAVSRVARLAQDDFYMARFGDAKDADELQDILRSADVTSGGTPAA